MVFSAIERVGYRAQLIIIVGFCVCGGGHGSLGILYPLPKLTGVSQWIPCQTESMRRDESCRSEDQLGTLSLWQ